MSSEGLYKEATKELFFAMWNLQDPKNKGQLRASLADWVQSYIETLDPVYHTLDPLKLADTIQKYFLDGLILSPD